MSAAIAAFSGLYYAIAVLTDSTYREEFLNEVTDEMRATFVARAEYLAARSGAAGLRARETTGIEGSARRVTGVSPAY